MPLPVVAVGNFCWVSLAWAGKGEGVRVWPREDIAGAIAWPREAGGMVVGASLWTLGHEAQLPGTCVWSTRSAGVNTLVVWQFSQRLLLVMWAPCLPVAVVPSWQLAQLPLMPL